MAAEINQSAEYAFSAQMEVQKLLAEMKAIASPTFQLPSASMSSLTAFDMESTVEEKEYLPAFAEQIQEREERLYWPSDLEVNGGSETELPYTFQEEEGEEEMLSLSSIMETVNEDKDDEAELSLPEEEEYFIPDEVEMEMEDDTDFIAEALLAPPPSLRPIPDVEEVVVEHIETEMLADDQTTQPHQAELEHMDASPIPDAEEVVAKEVVPEFLLANDNDETTQTHLAEVDHLVASPIPDAEELIAEPIEIEMLLENDHDQTAQPHQAELDHLDVSQQTKEEEERKLLEEKRDAIRQQAQAIRSSFKSSSSSSSSSSSESLDEDVSNAFKLAEEALASAALDEEVSHASKFAEEALASAALEEEVSHALKFAEEALASADMHDLTKGVEVTNNIPMVTQEQSFASPAPPESPPPLALVMEGIEVEAPINPQPEIKVTMPKENLGPVRSSPLARVLAGELGVKIEDVFPGSGLKGRVVADDVREYAATMTNV